MDRERRLHLERTYDSNDELWREVERGAITRENLDERAARIAAQLGAASVREEAPPSAAEWREYLLTLIEEHEEVRGGG
jgi:hypothetical protein